MFQGLAAQRLLALFAFGWLAFTFPLLGLWNVDATLDEMIGSDKETDNSKEAPQHSAKP